MSKNKEWRERAVQQAFEGGDWVERGGTSEGLCAYIILISEARSNVSNMGVLTITSITAKSMPALFQPLPLDISLNLNQ